MPEKKKNQIVTVYSTGDGNRYPVADEREKPRFIEKDPFENVFEKRAVRTAEREFIQRVKRPDGTIEERIFKERFKKKRSSK